MPTWMLTCSHCKTDFPHSKINTYRYANFVEAPKPDFPDEGLKVECPHCRHSAVYQRTDLRYRGDGRGTSA
jgi:DNA-directed RNA polymerase subunit RPC12/RpoP